jgi:hypothetical protein
MRFDAPFDAPEAAASADVPGSDAADNQMLDCKNVLRLTTEAP